MRDVYDFVKFFMKNSAVSIPNTYDGNMKLQKLLVFADFASIVQYGKPLFDDEVLAFKNGCVIEEVRLRYKYDYDRLKKESEGFDPNFSESEYNILNLILSVFGKSIARELSDINHCFDFWKSAYEKGTMPDGHHNKTLSVVDMFSNEEDIRRMREIISSYADSLEDAMQSDTINGIKFYYDGIVLTDELIDQLETFAISAEDNSYTVYIDDGELVIY